MNDLPSDTEQASAKRSPMPWRERFCDVMRYLRAQGYRRTWILRGRQLRTPGMMVISDRALRSANDNRCVARNQ